jgi:hypothetical protein
MSEINLDKFNSLFDSDIFRDINFRESANSFSRISSYLTCPLKWFCYYKLKREPDTYVDPSKRDQGSYCHDKLPDFYDTFDYTSLLTVKNDVYTESKKLFVDHFETLIDADPGEYREICSVRLINYAGLEAERFEELVSDVGLKSAVQEYFPPLEVEKRSQSSGTYELNEDEKWFSTFDGDDEMDVKIDQVRARGIADMVIRVRIRGGDGKAIVDQKFGKNRAKYNKSGDKTYLNASWKDSKQVAFYKLYLPEFGDADHGYVNYPQPHPTIAEFNEGCRVRTGFHPNFTKYVHEDFDNYKQGVFVDKDFRPKREETLKSGKTRKNGLCNKWCDYKKFCDEIIRKCS